MEDNTAAATVFLEALIARAFANDSQKPAKRAKDLASWLMPHSIPARSQQRKDGCCERGVDWDRSALRELAETGAVAAAGGRASDSNDDCREKREVEEEGREAALRAVEAEVGAIEHLVLLGQLAGASSSGDGGRGGGGGGGAESMLGRIGAARRAVLCVWRELQQTGAEGGGRRRRHALLAVCAHCEAALARAHAHTAAQLAVGQSRAAVRLAASSNRWLLLVAVLLPLQYATGLFGMNIA
ncbi:hypothetical protein IWW47_004303, partial [Coemansia sp. RSA 2052]